MITRKLVTALGLAVLFLAVAAGLRYAEGVGLVRPDTARWSIQVIIGLMLATYANFMPKQIGRPRGSAIAESRAQATLRFAGWSLTLAGLAYAALWAFAPIDIADLGSVTVVAAALAATMLHALWALTSCSGVRGPSVNSEIS
jgi:hypothetical protein